MSGMRRISARERCRGCLLGGAVGDALGRPVEFLLWKDIRERYGMKGITRLELVDGKARYAEDTQLALFTASGLLLAISEDADTPDARLFEAYGDWFSLREPSKAQTRTSPSWVWMLPELHGREPTRQYRLREEQVGENAVPGTMAKPRNRSRANGGTARVVPVGLLSPKLFDIHHKLSIGVRSAALTDGDPIAYLPAGILAVAIHGIVYERRTILDALRNGLNMARGRFRNSPEIEEIARLLGRAFVMSDSMMPERQVIQSLGEGWTGAEALAIAAYASLRHDGNVFDALHCAVNHMGDSAATGTIAGYLIGAWLGVNEVDASFDAASLESRDTILTLAEDLYQGIPSKRNPRRKLWVQHYGVPVSES